MLMWPMMLMLLMLLRVMCAITPLLLWRSCIPMVASESFWSQVSRYGRK